MRLGDVLLFKPPCPAVCHALCPSYTCRLHCLPEAHSHLRALAGEAIPTSGTPSPQRPTAHGPLTVPSSLTIVKPPPRPLTTKPESLVRLPSLSQNRFILYESLPDCTSSLSVVYGQLCTGFQPLLGCQLRGMGLTLTHYLASALGTVSGKGRLWLEGPPVQLCCGFMWPVLITNNNTDRSSPTLASQGSPGAFLTNSDSCHS